MDCVMNTVKRVTFLLILLLLSNCFYLPAAEAAGTEQQGKLELTQAEREFIEEHPIIHLGVDPTFVPYEFYDTDGEYKGIAADYIDLICEKTGLQMVVVENLTWSEAYEKAVTGEIDVLPCVAETPEREKYFLFSDSYYYFQRAIFVSQSNNTIKSFDDLYGKTVAVQTNSSHHDFLLQYNDIRLDLYSSVESALLAVSADKETAFVGNLATSTYLVKTYGITNLKYFIIDNNSDETQALHFAVRNDWPELIGIINKSLADITDEQKIEINNKWISIEENVDYSKIIKIVIIICVLIACIIMVSFFWVSKLKIEIKRRKEAEKELVAAKEEAEKANQTKSMFLARMSHEIRTPLNAITGMAYLIKKTELTVTQYSYLDKLTQAARNMLDIINDILDFSKIESGKIDIERVSFNLDEVLKRVINIASVSFEERGIDFNVGKERDVPYYFWGDPTRIEQILINIINNATKFTDKGSVTLSIRSISQNGKIYEIEFIVEDTGIGMSKEQLDRLFVPFDQGDSSINRRYGGTGLGLSIVKNLTDLMGGKIEVSSVLGKGSVFCIRLPLESDTDNKQLDAITMCADCFKNVRALVLEKSELHRNLIMQYCRSFGLNIESSASADDAIQRIYSAEVNEKQYDLFIVDFATPKNGGIKFFNNIKTIISEKHEIKYILLLPMLKENLYVEAEAAGIDFWITKPIIPSVLYNGIIEIFNIKPPESREQIEITPITLKNYHILLVEDNYTNQFIAQNILEQAGFCVSVANNGEEGYRFFENNHDSLDLILMDIHMPVMNGYDAADLIRNTGSDIPIIAMTADAVTGVYDTCKVHGIDYYVSKPFEPENFIGTITDVLKKTGRSARHQENGNGAPSVLNTADGIKRIGGDYKLYLQILQAFYTENNSIATALKDKIIAGDYDAAVQIVHKIKSSSGNIGAKSLFETAAELQKLLNAREDVEILKWHNKFQSLLNQLLIEITEILERQEN